MEVEMYFTKISKPHNHMKLNKITINELTAEDSGVFYITQNRRPGLIVTE